MNQSKFKFGDKVRLRDRLRYDTDPWVITVISLVDDEPKYSDSESSLFKESEIELYQEPQKKKIFSAHNLETRELKFFSAKQAALEQTKFTNWFSDPDYDIEYPSSEQTEALTLR